MSDIELTNIEATDPLMHSLIKNSDDCNGDGCQTSGCTGIYVDTDFGQVFVVPIGAPIESKKPFILTYHDIGLNFVSNYQAFFNFFEMKLLSESFCILNLHAPGQEENAIRLPDSYTFPTMDQLAQQVDSVCKHFGITNFIGFGAGAGANVLSRFALKFPEMVDGLFLINPTSTQASWAEWIYQRINIYYLGSAIQNFSQSMQDYLLWHHFGTLTENRNRDLIQVYRTYFSGRNHCARNLALFLDSYIKRSDLNIVRGNKSKNFNCSVLIICGALSPHVEDTVTMNSRLNPENSTWMKLSDCGMVLEEQPQKVSEAFRLFLQGLGYALTAFERRRSRALSRSQSEDDSSQKMHIVENPIAQC
ncbi:Protein NDRG3 [Sarcoptes scabiei]|uniref:Protein NDRG3 n=1 Tax=Sarcoptes scabiei TaxID=52283 RepID=A0A834R2D4_SARSC|nr:Protein NDRG3 [Sarcoptes scabiei]